MEHVRITYRMSRLGEVAESCIVLPMEAEAAEDILEYQEESGLVTDSGDTYDGQIDCILDRLAEIQGYDYAGFVMAELTQDATQEPKAKHKGLFTLTLE